VSIAKADLDEWMNPRQRVCAAALAEVGVELRPSSHPAYSNAVPPGTCLDVRYRANCIGDLFIGDPLMTPGEYLDWVHGINGETPQPGERESMQRFYDLHRPA
jgi:hypothetical protein